MRKCYQVTAPDTLEFGEGGGFLSLFGMPFLAAGVFVTLIGLGIIRPDNAAEIPWWCWPLLALMGLAFVAAGGGLVLGRRWTRLERENRRVIKQWGLLRPMKTEEHSLLHFQEVKLGFVAGDSDSPDSYPVSLSGSGCNDLLMRSFGDYGEARECGEFLTAFLKLTLRDAVNEPAQMLRWDGGQSADSACDEPQAYRPQVMHSELEETRESARITIRKSGVRFTTVLGLVIPLGILAWLIAGLLPFFHKTGTPREVQLVFVGLLVFALGVVPFLNFARGVLVGLRGYTRVTASPEGLRIEESGAIFTHRKMIAASEIVGLGFSTASGRLAVARAEAQQRSLGRLRRSGGHEPGSVELPAWVEKLARFAKAQGVTVKSRRGLYTFASGLPDDEVHYLYAVVKRTLQLGEQRAHQADNNGVSPCAKGFYS